MHNQHDQIAKLIALEIFEPHGKTETEQEVKSLDSQRMDLWYEAARRTRRIAGFLKLALRMGGPAAQLEFFSTICDSQAVRDVVRKQLNWHQHRRLVAQREKRRAPPLFRAWVITPGKPKACFARRQVRRAPGWPPGVYWTDPDTALWFVVVSELPRTRETLVLRLFGSPLIRNQALADIARIPDDDPEKSSLQVFVELLRIAVKDGKKVSEQERSRFMTEARAEQIRVHEQLRREGEQRGEQRGLQEARASLLDLCEVLDISVTPDRRRLIEQMNLDHVRVLRQYLKNHRAWPTEIGS